MRKLLIIAMLLLFITAISAQNSEKFLIKIDRSILSQHYGHSDPSQILSQLPENMNIFHISKGFILADADDNMLSEMAEGSYRLLETFPLDSNWFILTTLPGRANLVTSQLGTEITRMDESILLRTTHSEFELAEYTEMPYVKLDFTPLKIRLNPVLNTHRQTRVDFGDLLNQVNTDSIMWFIQQLQDFGTRNAGADNRLQVAEWIRDQFIRFGITNAHVEQFYVQDFDQYNVVATIPGVLSPDKYIIVGGHHDSILSSGDPTIAAPGADDNASGTTAALEIARIMQANNYIPECSIRFVTFACEEYGLWGSRFHAQQAQDEEEDIKLVINHDMLGFCTNTPDNWLIKFMPYDGALYQTAFAMEVTEAQTTLTPYAGGTNSAGSDSYSFWQRGFPAIYFFEDQFCPYYHSLNDVIANINPQYITEVIKASTAVCVSFDQTPSPASEITVTNSGTGNSLLVSWEFMNPEPDITSYKVYITDDVYVTPTEYTTTDSSYTLTGLTDGVLYYVGVAAMDSDNNTGLPIWATGTPLMMPEIPTGFEDLPGFQNVMLQWNPSDEVDLAGYNLYRSTNPDTDFVLLNSTPLTDVYYLDENVAELIYYYYKLTAVDLDSNESMPTEVVRTRAVTLNQGILIVDETSSGSSIFTPDDLVSDQFYDNVLHNFQISHYDTETDGSIKVADMGVYSSILWHGNDPGNLLYPYEHRDEIRKYLLAGGKVLISSYFPSQAFDNNNIYPFTYEAGDLMFDFFGIQDVMYNNNARFRYAVPEDSGFPPLTVDSLKTVTPLLGHIYNIESISANDVASNVYYYGSDYDNTDSHGVLNGTAVGVYINAGCGRSVMLSFPLFNMKQDEVTNLMYHVFHNLFGETVAAEDDVIVPQAGLALSRIYPNPFSNYLSFELEGVKANQPLTISVYNVKGQKVKTLFSSTAKGETQRLNWDGKDEQGASVSNSIYFIRAEQKGKAISGKIIKLQ